MPLQPIYPKRFYPPREVHTSKEWAISYRSSILGQPNIQWSFVLHLPNHNGHDPRSVVPFLGRTYLWKNYPRANPRSDLDNSVGWSIRQPGDSCVAFCPVPSQNAPAPSCSIFCPWPFRAFRPPLLHRRYHPTLLGWSSSVGEGNIPVAVGPYHYGPCSGYRCAIPVFGVPCSCTSGWPMPSPEDWESPTIAVSPLPKGSGWRTQNWSGTNCSECSWWQKWPRLECSGCL